MDVTNKQLKSEIEFLMGRVTALESALEAAGIAIPKTRDQIANELKIEEARLARFGQSKN